MSKTALEIRQGSPAIREDETPESTIREIHTQVHTQDPAYDFYDELTEPLWNPPLLQRVDPVLDSEHRLEDPSVEHPPMLSFWQCLWLALTGN